jgi:Holliday junction resolvase-like predicted endonuclease
MQRWDRLLPTLRASPDLALEVDTRRRQLLEILGPLDAVALLGQLVLAEMPRNGDSYIESEHSGLAYVIELAAAALATRADRSGARATAEVIDARTLTPLKALIWEIALLEGLRRYQRAGALSDDDALAGAQGRAAIAHLILRGPGWPWQESALLTGLLAPFAADLKGAIGFDASEGVACCEAATELVNRQFNEHMANADDHLKEVLEWAKVALGGWQDHPPGPFRDRALTAIWALMHAGEAMILRPDAVAGQASVSVASARAHLQALSTPFGQSGDLFTIGERVRFAPYLEVGVDEYFLTVPGNDLWALRPLFERALKTDRYTAHRGTWLEDGAVGMLAAQLQPDEVHTSVKIVAPDGRSVIGEIDGLIRFGDTILLVEAKAATMRVGARRGGRSLIKHLKATLTKASKQVELAHEVLHGNQEANLQSADGRALVLGEAPREIHPILVTLDDLSAVAPTVWEIAGSEVLPEGSTIPWIVTLHELDLVCRTVESPIQMIHFLRARSRLNQLGGRVASDELDWWMLYLKTGLYFEDAPAERLRVFSQTDDLDAWIMYERGERDRPADKPRQVLDHATEQLLSTLAAERPPGWVAAGCSILSASSDSRKRLARDISAARNRAKQRDLIQRGTLAFGEGPEPMLICWIAAPDSQLPVLSTILREYVGERVEEQGMQRVVGLATTVSSTRPYDALLVLERSAWAPPTSQE